jgi:hypothetical protein
MNLPNWEDRSVITANLLNPAFCGEIIRLVCAEHQKLSKKEISFAMIFIVLPLVLHKSTRDKLPKRKVVRLHDWINSDSELKLGLAERIKYLVPYTRETLLFLYQQDILTFSEEGHLKVLQLRKKKYPQSFTEEVKDILSKSAFIGRWLTTFPKEQMTYTILGIQP